MRSWISDHTPQLLNAASEGHSHTLLWEAANAGKLDLVKFLVEADVDERDSKGRTALHNAARTGFTRVLELLLTAGADVNVRMQSGETPLALAIAKKRHAAAELLRAYGGTV